MTGAGNATIFLPSEAALASLGDEERVRLANEATGLKEMLLHHTGRAVPGEGRRAELETMGGGKLRVASHHHWLEGQGTTVQCARVATRPVQVRGAGGTVLMYSVKVCGGQVVTIDRLLTPPKGNVLETLARSNLISLLLSYFLIPRDHKEFAKLVKLAGMEQVNTPSTVRYQCANLHMSPRSSPQPCTRCWPPQTLPWPC